MVERKTLNLVVVGSIPTGGAFYFCFSAVQRRAGAHRIGLAQRQAALAQLGERQTEDLKVPGSIPGGGTFWFARFWSRAAIIGSPFSAIATPPWPNG